MASSASKEQQIQDRDGENDLGYQHLLLLTSCSR